MNEPIHSATDDPSTSSSTAPPGIFIGPEGLRPFWGLLLYLAILLTPLLLFLLAAHLAHHGTPAQHASQEQPPFPMLIREWLLFGFVFFATWIMSRIEHRSVFDYGLPRVPQRWRWLIVGAVLGVLFQSLLILMLWSTHHLVFAGFLLRPSAGLAYGLLWGVGFVGVGFFEEFLFRGYLQFNLTRCFAGLVRSIAPTSRNAEAIGFWVAAAFISFGFGLVHGSNPGESPIGLLCAGAAGLMFAFTLWRTGSLWWAIGLHAGWDWAQSFFFGVADSGGVSAHRLLATHPVGSTLLSGGLTGPEGSLFVFPVMVAITIVAALTLPRRPASLQLWTNTETQLAATVHSAHE
ncbi:MAG TPA: CPBP family intramembrane glutamic endopeptidase [Acidobacteriaceae bacterium]